MIITHQQPFRVSKYHERVRPEEAGEQLIQGPILAVKCTFEWWLEGQELEADAFVDTGADCTIISARWLEELRRAHGANRLPFLTRPDPMQPRDRFIEERVWLDLAGSRFEVPPMPAGIPVRGQSGGEHGMPGSEDVLLGRDFLVEHGVLFAVDGTERTFSLLVPNDDENRLRRERVLSALDPSAVT